MARNDRSVYKLNIDPGFKALIYPSLKMEYALLEKSILSSGCLDSLIVWNGTIVDGHKRYEICHRHQIPFGIEEKDFSSREDAIAWICTNQLKRRNLSNEARKYLIGIKYESENRLVEQYNQKNRNQFSKLQENGRPYTVCGKTLPQKSRYATAKKIGSETHLAASTIQRYGAYARDLEALREKVPEVIPRILSGSYKISRKDIARLTLRTPEEIKRVLKEIEEQQAGYARYRNVRNQIRQQTEDTSRNGSISSIKDMPKPDPDAELNGLRLTIPSWVSSMERVRNNADFEQASLKAIEYLLISLQSLADSTERLILTIRSIGNGQP